MNRLVIDRRDTCGITSMNLQNWLEIIDDNLNTIPFIKLHLDRGDEIKFSPIFRET
jgi:hypothetical protein